MTDPKITSRLFSEIEYRTVIICKCGCEHGTPHTGKAAERRFKRWGWDVENKICPDCVDKGDCSDDEVIS